MAKQADFDSFISRIEPSLTTIEYISSVQINLRDYLKKHADYKDIYVDSFLSGSYSKHTSIRPAKGDKKRDVDIVVVTKYKQSTDSRKVLEELLDVLLENTTYSSARIQHHSIGIELAQISMDIVPVIKDDLDELYYVGDSSTGLWEKTDPKGHKEWSTRINQEHNCAYKPLVKILKWWRRIHCPTDIKMPKGITLEKIIADNLGDSTQSTEDFLIETMQNIIVAYKEDYANANILPVLNDPSPKIKDNNLLEGYTIEDFTCFINKIEEHLELLNSNGTVNDSWRSILGNEFPIDSQKKSSSNNQCCLMALHRQKPMWPMMRGGAALIVVKVFGPNGNRIEYQSNGDPLDKNCSLHFRVLTGVKQPFTVKWQITNTGEEARSANCLRGYFENSDDGITGKTESTSYSGSHSIQCFIIKKNICVAKSKEYIINIR